MVYRRDAIFFGCVLMVSGGVIKSFGAGEGAGDPRGAVLQ